MSDDENEEKELDLSNVSAGPVQLVGSMLTVVSDFLQSDVVTKYKTAAEIANSKSCIASSEMAAAWVRRPL